MSGSGTEADPLVLPDVETTATRVVPPPPAAVGDYDNTVSVTIGGTTFMGWESVRISRSLEKTPSSFELIATERSPDTGAPALLPAGSPCLVKIGSTVVLTGYVDRYTRSINPRQHEILIQGRGKCSDLVDCSVTADIINGMQVTTSSLLDLANKMGAHFGPGTAAPPTSTSTTSPITAVSLTGGDVPLALPGGGPMQLNATLQETPYEILEKLARFAGVLIYEGTDGNLVLANAGTSTMASGFVQGVNVQQAAATSTLDDRFSEYDPALMSVETFNMPGATPGIGTTPLPPAFDAGVPRFRPLIVVSPQFVASQSFAVTCAQWEAARRLGRSQMLRVTCDNWRDSAGVLWAVNAFAPIDIAAVGLPALAQNWVIGEVDFILNAERGTVADLMLMPVAAFAPQPIILTPNFNNPNANAPAGGGAAADDAAAAGDGSGPASSPALPPAGGGAKAP